MIQARQPTVSSLRKEKIKVSSSNRKTEKKFLMSNNKLINTDRRNNWELV